MKDTTLTRPAGSRLVLAATFVIPAVLVVGLLFLLISFQGGIENTVANLALVHVLCEKNGWTVSYISAKSGISRSSLNNGAASGKNVKAAYCMGKPIMTYPNQPISFHLPNCCSI